MKEYKTLYYITLESFPSGNDVMRDLENDLNDLAREEWIMKLSGMITVSTENAKLATYAVLERDKPSACA